MTDPGRLPVAEAALRWLDAEHQDRPSQARMRQALTDLVEGRYHGHAAALKRVHELRSSLLEDDRRLEDLSDATRGPWDAQTVGEAAGHSAPPDQGRLLFHLTRAFQPLSVVELGTNVGISAAYIGTALEANARGRLRTLEVSGVRLGLAEWVFRQLGLTRITTIEGYFDDTLAEALAAGGPVDLAFVDGNHTEEATVRYFGWLTASGGPEAVLVFDDIRWSDGMRAAWTRIGEAPEAAWTVDLGRTGIVVLG